MEEKEFEELNKNYEYDIVLDSDKAKQIGFTSDKYVGYIHVDYGHYWLCVESKSGDVNDIGTLIDNIHKFGCEVVIENPSDEIVGVCKLKPMLFVQSGETVSRIFTDIDRIINKK